MTKPGPISWSPDSWKNFPAPQQPDWPDDIQLKSVLDQLASYPPLVFAEEVNSLKHHLAEAAQGNAFLIQGGDCAETFTDFSAEGIRDKLKILLQMAVILTYGTSCKVIKVGRIAGQFAKPRTRKIETRNGITLPAYRGDCVNKIEFTQEARIPDPRRLIRAYNQSASTLNLLRAFTTGGFADLNKVHLWNREFLQKSKLGKRYEKIAERIDDALRFTHAWGISTDNNSALRLTELFTSHEGLLLGYEQALTRTDSLSGAYYDCSAHMLWIGDRTRSISGAHVAFFTGVQNPIGIKLGPGMDIPELIQIIRTLNPENAWGRITLISRLGAEITTTVLPEIIRAVKREKLNVLWICDPMHGNTFITESGHKTRSFDTIIQELEEFFAVHDSEGTIAGGVHFELTGENVTECLGGAQQISRTDLDNRYESACDPRLNNEQSLELAFLVTNLIQKYKR